MTVEEIKVLGDSEMETGRSLALGLGIVGLAVLAMIGLFLAAVGPNLLLYAVPGGVAFGSAVVTGVLFWAYRRRNGLIQAFKDYKYPASKPARSAPALPEASNPIKAVSRGGDICGFHPATLMWVCDNLANGVPWTEGALEKMTVPHMQPPTLFGKAEVGTPYYRLFHSEHGIFCRAGIITGRGGPGNPTGKLTTRSPLEMLRMLKELPLDSAFA